jgi:prepilin-type N-terminal cleavage/methylation domain-containing protein
MHLRSSSRGFTLIELLVVIAIIGLLASVVLASLNTARDKARNASVKSTMNQMRIAAELYYSSNANRYQTGTSNVTSCTGGMYVDAASNMQRLVSSLTGIVSQIDCGVAANGQSWTIAVRLPTQDTETYGGTNRTINFLCIDSEGHFSGIKKSTTSGTAYTSLVGSDNSAHRNAGGIVGAVARCN